MNVQVNYVNPYEVNQYLIEEVVKAICSLNDMIGAFWPNCEGWAPVEAVKLLGSIRLDWQSELSRCLFMWIDEHQSRASEGHLILAWVNLGSLIEGTLKFFLSVYLEDYRADLEGARAAGSLTKSGTPKSVERLKLDQLRKFFKENSILDKDGEALVELVQKRRNVIHAFKDGSIGTWDEFKMLFEDIIPYCMVSKIASLIPTSSMIPETTSFDRINKIHRLRDSITCLVPQT